MGRTPNCHRPGRKIRSFQALRLRLLDRASVRRTNPDECGAVWQWIQLGKPQQSPVSESFNVMSFSTLPHACIAPAD